MTQALRVRWFSLLILTTVALYVLAVPVVLVWIMGWSGYDLARLLQWPVLTLAALAALLAEPASAPPPLVPRASGAGMLALAVLSVALAPVPAMAARELALFTGLLAVAAAVARLGTAGTTAALRVAVLAAGPYALLVTGIAAAATLAGETVSRRDLFVGYDNHRFYSHVLTVAIPLALAARWTLPAPAWRRAADATLVLLCAMMLATGGRGTMLALAVATLAVAVRLGRTGWPLLRPLAVAVGAGALLFTLLFVAPTWLQGTTAGALADYGSARLASDQARLPLWSRALEMAAASPWLGAGPMHFAHGANPIAAAPHSLPLQVAAEWGWPMLALLALAIALLLRRTWQRLGTPAGRTGLGAGLAIGVVAVLLDALVSGNFVVPMSQVWIAALLGLLWAWLAAGVAPADAPAPHPSRRWPARAAAAAVLGLQVWLGTQMLPEAARIGEHLRAAMAAFPTERHQPRFWSHGRF